MSDSDRRVLIVTSGFPRWLGDVPGFFVFELAQGLLRQGYRVTVLAPDDGSAPKREMMHGVQVHRFSYFWPRRWQRVCYGSGIPDNLRHSRIAWIQFPFFVLCQLGALARLVRREHPHVINAHWIITQGLNGAIVRKFIKSAPPMVMTVHAAGVFALNRVLGGGILARFIVRQCHHVFSVSSYVRETLWALAGREGKVSIVPMGINTAEFCIDRDPKQLRRSYNFPSGKMLLYVGRLADKKGVNYLLEALPAVLGEIPEAYLAIVGEGHLKADLQAQAERLGLKEHVHFMGAASHDQVICYLHMADLVVIPSIVDKMGQTEGMPVVLMEALAAGKPTVASAVSGVCDALKDGENGFLVLPAESAHLAHKITEALNQDLGRISAAAYATGQQYDWERVIDRYEAVFESLVV